MLEVRSTELKQKVDEYQIELNQLGKEIAINNQLIKDKVIDFVGSDCHHEQHLDMLLYASKMPIFHQLIPQQQLLNTSL